MKQTLEKGSNLLVSPGGIAEIYETNSSEVWAVSLPIFPVFKLL